MQAVVRTMSCSVNQSVKTHLYSAMCRERIRVCLNCQPPETDSAAVYATFVSDCMQASLDLRCQQSAVTAKRHVTYFSTHGYS